MTFVELPLSNETTSGTDSTMTPSETEKKESKQNNPTHLNYCE